MATTTTTCQAVWMRKILRSLYHEQVKGTSIYCDNSSAIALSKNSVFHKRTKHIDAKYHYIRELVNNGNFFLQHCGIAEQFSNILTKSLGQKSFNYLRKCLGMQENTIVVFKGGVLQY